MKRFLLLSVAILLVFSLVSCKDTEISSGDKDKVDKNSMSDIDVAATEIIKQYKLSGGTRYSSSAKNGEQKLDDDLILSYYGVVAEAPDFSEVEAYAIYIDETKPLDPCEFGIFKMKDGADTERFMMFLKTRLNTKIENAKAYPTMDTSALKSAKFGNKNGYIWYCAVKGANAEIDSKLKGSV